MAAITSSGPTPLFVFLQAAGGQVGLPLFVATMLVSSKVKRHMTLINFCWTWIVYSIVYCLTAYNGQRNFEGAGARLCTAQAILTHGVVPLCSTAAWTLHLQIILDLYSATHGHSWIKLHRRKLMASMLAAPYLAFFVFTIWCAAITAKFPEKISRNGVYYCSIDYEPIIHAIPAYSAAMVFFAVVLQFLIIRILLLRWETLRQIKVVNHRKLSLIVRTAILTVYSLVVVGAGLMFLAEADSTWAYFIQASVPTVIYLIFGLRGDVMEAWRIWPRFRCTGARWRSPIQAKSANNTDGWVAVQRGRMPIRVLLLSESSTSLSSLPATSQAQGPPGIDTNDLDKNSDLELGRLEDLAQPNLLESVGYRISLQCSRV